MFENFKIPTPCHIFDMDQLKTNLSILKLLGEKTHSKVLYAIKGCSQQEILPYISEILDGACTSGYNEILLANKFKFREIHTFSTAYKENEISMIAQKSDVVIFNSIYQFNKYNKHIKDHDAISGLRINPFYSEIKNNKINPCAINSRFGVSAQDLKQLAFIPEYLHFHSMCEQYSDTLERTFAEIENIYGQYFKDTKTINIGGGQLYTSAQYDLTHAVNCINNFKSKHNVSIVLEPCEAILYNVGYLIGSVLDIKPGFPDIAILDLSAVCHIPDIVYSDYKYKIIECFEPNVKKYTYTLAGPTCYSGDIFGEFSFDKPLCVGSKIIICDTAHYTTVKSSMFNGISLPSIALYSKHDALHLKRIYKFKDYLSIT